MRYIVCVTHIIFGSSKSHGKQYGNLDINCQQSKGQWLFVRVIPEVIRGNLLCFDMSMQRF